jgi:hypothetical protein
MEVLTIFVIGPTLGVGIAYAAWRGKPKNFRLQQYGILCVGSGSVAFLLLGLAKWINADVRTPLYFWQLAMVLLGGLILGVSMGCLFPFLLHLWRWHKSTRLAGR